MDIFVASRTSREHFVAPDVVLVQTPGWGISTPPLALALLSAFLRARGYRVLPLDLNVEHFLLRKPRYQNVWDIDLGQSFWNNTGLVEEFIQSNSELVERHVAAIVETGTPLVAFSLYNSCLNVSAHYAKRIRQLNPKIKIVFGGPHASRNMAGYWIVDHDCVDAAAQGEGEFLLLDIVERVRRGASFDDCPGLLLKLEGRYVDNGDREPIRDLDALPFADFSDYDFANYRDSKTLPIMSSRGCPNECIYCSEVQYWRTFRGYAPERIVDEIGVQLARYPFIDRIEFQDSLVNGQIKRLERFAELVVDRGLKFRWAGQAVIRKEMRLELFKKLKASGCECLAYGLESSSPALMLTVGKLLAKNTDIDLLVEEAHQAGLSCAYNFMFGMPSETEEDAAASLEFLRKHKDHVGAVNPSTAFCGFTRGTPGYDEPKKFKIVPSPTAEQYWETEDGSNNLLVRLRRFEAFCELAAELKVPTTYPHRRLVDRDRLLGCYHFHYKRYPEALEHLEPWLDGHPDDHEIRHKVADCYEAMNDRVKSAAVRGVA